MTELLHLDRRDRTAWITINRPAKRNAMTWEMWSALLAGIKSIEEAPDVTAVVLEGTGGSFSAGADLAEVKRPDPQYVASYRALAEQAVRALMELRTPKLAVIDGPCFGAACSMALACDVRICSPRSQFGIPALKHGLTYEPVFLQRLAQIVGPGSAGLLIFGAERWDADEAAVRGLVDRCTDDVSATVEQILAVLKGVPAADIAMTAAALRAG
ncbi:enoyl-CoA hydratase/isomerase family protein [Kribbella turkmenica]|jgi:enoyl-CoA hydratase/carnithine racemase|uniref:Enoyl-CoA hydratase/isomerase family protein n=1 Tax=Kribbella turkmenica TaxID=2530375 RepID=A0A4R4XBR8_9ACTN|nr:enoyl-CoA hydratase/isomerase family protein [Kribbella turkmenica]TDD27912.1 enoyl-CoA hydratase/isomerase family protein [Kribbella turkmenica]